MPQTTFTTSATGTAVLVLNPVSKSTLITFTSTTANTTSGSSNSAIQIDMATGDPSALGAPSLAWTLLSSAATIKSTDIAGNGLSYTLLSPVGAVRINVTTASTAAATFFNWTLSALQSVTA